MYLLDWKVFFRENADWTQGHGFCSSLPSCASPRLNQAPVWVIHQYWLCFWGIFVEEWELVDKFFFLLCLSQNILRNKKIYLVSSQNPPSSSPHPFQMDSGAIKIGNKTLTLEVLASKCSPWSFKDHWDRSVCSTEDPQEKSKACTVEFKTSLYFCPVTAGSVILYILFWNACAGQCGWALSRFNKANTQIFDECKF